MECVDPPVSITEEQMKMLVREVRKLETILGNGAIHMSPVEEGAQIFRRHD